MRKKRPRKQPSQDLLVLASALAGVLSARELRRLSVRVDPNAHPHYLPERDEIVLPGLPFGNLPESVRDRFRAYLAHEAIGERGLSTWFRDTEITQRPALAALVNGMNDARIDRAILRTWPGSGMAIRRAVQEDFEAAPSDLPLAPHNVATMLRYIGERVTTPEEVAARWPAFGDTMARITPILEQTNWDGDEAHIIAQARAIHAALGWDPEAPCAPPKKSDQPAHNRRAVTVSSEQWGEGESVETRTIRSLRPYLAPEVCTPETPYTMPPVRNLTDDPPGSYEVARAWYRNRLLDAGVVARLVRTIRAIQAAEGRVIMRRQETGELDEDLLGEALGRDATRVMYRRTRGQVESLAVYIACDESLSQGPHGRIEAQRVFVACLIEALGRLGVPCRVTGWHGETRRRTRDYVQGYPSVRRVVKDWSDHYRTPRVMHAVAELEPRGYNSDVAAIAEGYAHLAARPEERRLLVYLTDGEPVVDWLGVSVEGGNPQVEVPAAVLRDIVRRAAMDDITVVGVGIGLDGEGGETMRRIFGAGYVAVEETGWWDTTRMAYDLADGFLAAYRLARRRGGGGLTRRRAHRILRDIHNLQRVI